MPLRSFRSVLDDCLAALQRGEAVESCLARYPRQAERLRPLLTLAQRVSRTPQALPRSWAQASAWNSVRRRATELRSGRRGVGINISLVAVLRPIAVLSIALFALGAAGSATALAAQDSLPDSPLYGVKLATEEAYLWFIFDDTREAEELLNQSNRRMDEITKMVRQGKTVPANVLTAMADRNARAMKILAGNPGESGLWARAQRQAEVQQRLLIAFWPDIQEWARPQYTDLVADLHNIRLSSTSQIVSALRPEELAGGIMTVSGIAQPLENGLWSIGGLEVRIDERTIGGSQITPGSAANFIFAISSNGRRHALSLSPISLGEPSQGALVSGEVEEIREDSIRLAGEWFPITPDTLLPANIREGQHVKVTLEKTESGIVAARVTREEPSALTSGAVSAMTWEGTVEGEVTRPTAEWTVGGLVFKTTPSTRLDFTGGNAAAGARAQVEAIRTPGGELIAQSITILASQGQPDSVHFAGAFEGSRPGVWLVSGLEVEPRPGLPEPQPGTILAVEGIQHGAFVEMQRFDVIQPPGETRLVRLIGTVLAIEDSRWDLGVHEVRVSSTSRVSGKGQEGARVMIWARPAQEGIFQAVYVRVMDQRPVTPQPDDGADD
jgi:hypothetical protein